MKKEDAIETKIEESVKEPIVEEVKPEEPSVTKEIKEVEEPKIKQNPLAINMVRRNQGLDRWA